MDTEHKTIAVSKFEKMIITPDVAKLHKELILEGMREIKAPSRHGLYGYQSFVQDLSGVLIELRCRE